MNTANNATNEGVDRNTGGLQREGDDVRVRNESERARARATRALNRLPPLDRSLAQLPSGIREEIWSMLADAHEANPGRYAIPFPICDGTGVRLPLENLAPAGAPVVYRSCESEALAGANQFRNQLASDPIVSQIMQMGELGLSMDDLYGAFPGGLASYGFDVAGVEENPHADPGTALLTHADAKAYEQLTQKVHKLHAVGFEMGRKAGYDFMRARFYKTIVLVAILLNIPLVQAAKMLSPAEAVFYEASRALVGATSAWYDAIFAVLRYYLASVAIWAGWFLFAMHTMCWYVHDVLRYYFEAAHAAALKFGIAASMHAIHGSPLDQENSTSLVDAEAMRRQAVVHVILYLFITTTFCVLLPRVVSVTGKKLFNLAENVSARTKCMWREMVWKNLSKFPWRSKFSLNMDAGSGFRWTNAASQPILEMAISGSQFFRPKHVPGLMAIVVHQEDETTGLYVYKHIGMSFRYKGHLVTALHVVDAADRLQGEAYVVPVVVHLGGSRLDLSKKVPLSVDSDANIVPEAEAQFYDIAILPLGDKFFSKVGVCAVKAGASSWGAPVSTYGFHKDEILYSATGSRLKQESGVGRIAYNASTKPGWSGCPVLTGRRVVALHQSTDKEVNIGLDMVVIEHLASKYSGVVDEKSMLDYEFRWDDVVHVVRNKRGMVVDHEEDDMGNMYLRNQRTGRREAFLPEFFKKFDRDELDQMTRAQIRDAIDAGQVSRENRRRFGESTENVELAPQVTAAFEDAYTPSAKMLPMSSDRLDLDIEPNPYIGLAEQVKRVVRTAEMPKEDEKTRKLLSEREAVATELGYDPQSYRFPETKTQSQARRGVARSLKTNLQRYVKACSNPAPTDELRRNAKQIVRKLLSANKYQMVKNCLSEEHLNSIINSSRIDETRSPGFPFIEEGITNNGDAIARGNLTQLVQDRHSQGQEGNMFGKGEAQKKAKLDAGQLRTIVSVSLIDAVSAHAFFANANDTMIANHKKSPIMGGWSPLVPMQAKWFYDTLDRKAAKIYSHDIKHWEFSITDWLIQDGADILVSLAVRSPDMSEDDAVHWRQMAREEVIKQFTLPWRLPDGQVVERKVPGMMTSGSVLTFLMNSIFNLHVDTVAKLIYGYSAEDLVDMDGRKPEGLKFKVRVGGDDNIQRVPKDFDADKFVGIWRDLGFEVHDQMLLDSMEDAEFFSWKFNKTSMGVECVPLRFCKHVSTLGRVKYDNLGQALLSHMRNWAYSEPHFRYFEDLYVLASKEDPERFPLGALLDMHDIRSILRGFECDHPVQIGEIKFDPHDLHCLNSECS